MIASGLSGNAMASMRTGLAILAFAVCAAATPLPARAQVKPAMTVERYQRMVAAGEFGKALIGPYLHALLDGLHATHVDFTQRGDRQKPIYCIPGGTVLIPSEISAELLREFTARPELYKPDMPVGSVVLEIIRRKFPCS
jgi:hypothetical protein